MPPRAAVRFMRKMMLAYGKRMDPDRMLQLSRQGALRTAVHAARHSKAYRSLLQEHGLDPDAIGSETDLRRLPVLTKANTFGRFGLADLARPVSTNDLADVLTSSGRGGKSFGFRLTERKQHEASWFDIDLGLQDVFNVDELPTLLVNCLPMGVVFRSRAVTVANVSVREDMACSILRDVGPRFAQTLLCTDPLFVRRVLDEARLTGVDWKALNTSVIMGEEVLVETQRDYIAERMQIGLDGDPHRMIGSSFGVGELGLNLLFETRDTIRMRRALRAEDASVESLGGAAKQGATPLLFCYNPLRSHVEVLNPDAHGLGELCFTMLDRQAVIPLPRFATGDLGRLIPRDAVAAFAARVGAAAPWLPVVELHGRLTDRPPGLPSAEMVKGWIYTNHSFADILSGAFRLSSAKHTGPRLALQSTSDDIGGHRLAEQGLAELATAAGFPGLEIELLPMSRFPWRPALDYERKFAYVEAAVPVEI